MIKKKFTVEEFIDVLYNQFGGDMASLISIAYRFIGHHSQMRKHGFNSLGYDFDCLYAGDTALPKKLYKKYNDQLFEKLLLARQTGKSNMIRKYFKEMPLEEISF